MKNLNQQVKKSNKIQDHYRRLYKKSGDVRYRDAEDFYSFVASEIQKFGSQI